MARSARRLPRRGTWESATSTVTLALLQLRKTWRLLVVAGTGILIAVVLVCSVPLYSQGAMNQGLRNTLNATAGGSYVTIYGVPKLLAPPIITDTTPAFDAIMQSNLGQYIKIPPSVAIQSQFLLKPGTAITLVGSSMEHANAHAGLFAGRLPRPLSSDIEIAITPEEARGLHAQVGSEFTVPLNFTLSSEQTVSFNLPLHVVGIFTPARSNDLFWHGETFASELFGDSGILYPMLVSNETFLSVGARLTSSPAFYDATLNTPVDAFLYYDLDTSRLDINKLDDVINGLNTALVEIVNAPQPYFDHVSAFGPTDLLQQYRNRVMALRVPLTNVTYLIVGLVLFFVSLMTEVLVEWQTEAIAMLRSRGASRWQVFGALVTQSLGVGLISLLLGPLLALLVVGILLHGALSAATQASLSSLLGNPLQVIWELRWSILATVGVGVLVMIIAVSRPIRMDVLTLRRETARSTRPPLWQRLRLDLLAAVIALTGFGFSLYITSPGVLDMHVRIFILPLIVLIRVLFLLLGGMLLFLRVFPRLLDLVARRAAHSRGATPMLALAQIARAPRQSLRMTMLLTIAVAFSMFTGIFITSQQQRIRDVAAYQVGSDFSGAIPTQASTQPLDQQIAAYQHIPGVLSATTGYVAPEGVPGAVAASIELQAMDADTYASTMIWTQQESSQPVAPLMAELVARRAQAMAKDVIPAIVDTAAAQTLHLSSGTPFALGNYQGHVNFVTIAVVNRIPTISDTTESSGTSDTILAGGIVVDYASYAAVVAATLQVDIGGTTNIWLRTKDDAASLANVREALNYGDLQLATLNDRRALIESLSSDPFYLALFGLLFIGAATALILALVGNLTASWLSARSRLTSFVVMRALGSTPYQIARILTVEQGFVYAAALALGIMLGLLLSFLVLPNFIFTTAVATNQLTTAEFYVLQNVPPIQVIVSPGLLFVALGVLVVICCVALIMMVRVVLWPSIGQTLRLNED